MQKTSKKNVNRQQKVKVLFCIDNLIYGGTELQLVGLLDRLDREVYEPYLLTIRPTDVSFIPEGVTHLKWNVSKLASWSGLKQLFKLVKFLHDEHFSIVQTYFQDSTIFAGIAAWLARVPVRIACFRDLGFWQNTKQNSVLKVVYSLMTGYICNAEVIKRHFHETFGVVSSKIEVIRNGIDTSNTVIPKVGADVKDIVIVGNMTRQVKRIDLFIQAAAIVAKKFPEIKWHILGDGHLRVELEKMAYKLGLAKEQVVFAGRCSDVRAYLESMDIGVLCSDSEGLSNALLEYMLAGLPVVATKVGGTPELLIQQKTGLLVPVNDKIALADALTRLIKNTVLRQNLADHGYAKVLAEYSWQRSVESYEDYYRSRYGGH
ncbi:MAG: glycosyltransferase [Gammaproteobacteria bacterium]|nr:glycosyltransferase [Gammaproteobacteria bacterium]